MSDYWSSDYWAPDYWAGDFWAGASTGEVDDPRLREGGSGGKKKRNIPPIRLSDRNLYYPQTWEEYSRMLPPIKRGKSPDEEAQEERERQEEELAIVAILKKLYEE